MKKFVAPKLQKENIICSRIVERLIIILISISFIGCSTKLPQTPDYFAIDLDSHVPKIDRIALVTDSTPPLIESIDLGVTQGEGAGGGAAGGAIGGAVYSLYLGPAYFIVLPYLVTAGAIGGAISGAAVGYSADVLEEAETQVEQILNSGYLQNKLLTKMELYTFGQAFPSVIVIVYTPGVSPVKLALPL